MLIAVYMTSNDTIAAIATPPGRGGIGVIRISGADALGYARKLLKTNSFNPIIACPMLRTIPAFDSDAPLDQALFTYFKSPNSYTGEDVIEISCHSSPVLLLAILDFLFRESARPAEPGEFTLRAFLNGKLSLVQAEAVRDLINAKTSAAVRQAARQLGGELSLQLQPLKNELIRIIVLLESALEFVEDDLPSDILENLRESVDNLILSVEKFASTYYAGRLLKSGIKTALIGRPNVGKSSVFNLLLGQERAIVTPIAGTTRDVITEETSVDGIPLLLTDTAGLRQSEDIIERIGIERTQTAITSADLLLIVLAANEEITLEEHDLLNKSAHLPRIAVFNKIDLAKDFKTSELPSATRIVRLSAKTGAGADELRQTIVATFAHDADFTNANFIVTDARHYDLMLRTNECLKASQNALAERRSEEIIVADLRDALRFLGEITGETTSDDIIGRIFSTFCIGK